VDTLLCGRRSPRAAGEARSFCAHSRQKGLLLASGVEPPRIHDVSDILLAERHRLPAAVRGDVDRLAAISKDLRRDRELAFYGAEDLTPSRSYGRPDAVRALDGARLTVRLISPLVAGT